MADYFLKILHSLRNCNVASSPALRLGGASEQLSGLCLRSHDPHLLDLWRAHLSLLPLLFVVTQLLRHRNTKDRMGGHPPPPRLQGRRAHGCALARTCNTQFHPTKKNFSPFASLIERETDSERGMPTFVFFLC